MKLRKLQVFFIVFLLLVVNNICFFQFVVPVAASTSHTFDTSLRFESLDDPATQDYTCGAGTTVLVLGIVIDLISGEPHSGGAPTFNGVALTQANATKTATETSAELWYLLGPPTGSAYSISIPNTDFSILKCIASSYKASAGKTSVLDVASGLTGVSASPTVNVTTTTDGDAIVDICGDGRDTKPTASHTLLYSTDDGTYSDNAQYTLQASAGLASFKWTVASDDWCMIVVAFKESGGAANTAPTIPDLRLSSTSDTTNITQIDVNTWYDWEANVSDTDTLNDIVNVTIRLKDNPTDSIITDSAAYNRTGEYWFNYVNTSNTWQWYSGSSWTDTSDWLDNANCSVPTKTGTSGYYLFRTKLAKSAVHTATWMFSAMTNDSAGNVASKNFTGITVNAYSSLTIMSGNSTHTWNNATAGVNDILIDQDAIYFNVTTNYLFKIQAEGDGNLIKGSDYIVLANVTIHKDTLASSVPLTTSYADVVGLTSQALAEDVQLSLKLWLDSPANQPVGDYIYELQIQVTEQ